MAQVVEATPVTAVARRSTARTAVMIAAGRVVATTERCAKAGVRALVQIGSSPPWPGPQLGLGELAVENQGELVDHGVLQCSRFRRTNAPMSLAPNSGFLPSSRS